MLRNMLRNRKRLEQKTPVACQRFYLNEFAKKQQIYEKNPMNFNHETD
jgi:hypothetical protein